MKYGEALITMILALLVVLFSSELAHWLWRKDYLTIVFTVLFSVALGAKVLQFIFWAGKQRPKKS